MEKASTLSVENHIEAREQAVHPDKTALLIIDMQNGECGEPLRKQGNSLDDRHKYLYSVLNGTVIPNQIKLLNMCRTVGIEIIYTTIESLTPDGRDRSLDYKISGIHFPRGSWESRVIDEIAPEISDIHIPKTSSSVFNSTNIDYVLGNLGIEYLVICGIITEQCVESAIRDAADLGYLVTQIHDCCASYSWEAHKQSIDAMNGHYCRSRSTEEFNEELSRSK